MKPDDIPEDVWESAVRCAEVVCRNLPENYGDMTIEIRAIARAILAERERIASFVETHMTLDPEASDFIAAAIRSGAAPTSPSPST